MFQHLVPIFLTQAMQGGGHWGNPRFTNQLCLLTLEDTNGAVHTSSLSAPLKSLYICKIYFQLIFFYFAIIILMMCLFFRN